ncbi:MAG: hypothetical protein ACJ75T_06575 [Solirubrobacterales bacterium]
MTVATCGSAMPTIIGVYIGDTLSSLREVATNAWDWPGCGLQQGVQATFKAIAGRVYSIQVDGNIYHEPSQPPVSGQGAVALQIRHRPPPPNDDFADAEAIQLGGLNRSVPNFGATKEVGEPDHRGDKGGASVWYKLTASRSGGALIQVSGGSVGHDSLIAVYTGASVDQLTPVPGTEVWGSSTLAFPVTAGVTYRIAIDGKYDPATESPFMDEPEMGVSLFPGNDDFEHAWSLPSGPLGGTAGINGLGSIGATKQPGEPDHAGNHGGASVWFTTTALENGSAQLSACGASFRTLIAVYTGPAVGALTPIASSDNPQAPACALGGGTPGEVEFNLDAGTTYWIAVDGYEGAWGTFALQMSTSTSRLPDRPIAPGRVVDPQTRIAKRHVNRRQRVAVFHLESSDPAPRFLCKLDSRPFAPCGSTVRLKRLKPGKHSFAARSVSEAGLRDPTPVVFRFSIPRPRA